jgi:acyl-CoA synthetase (NDP forming)
MLLSQKSAMYLLNKYGLKYPKTDFFKLVLPKNLQYPVALKVDSPQVIHKSDLGLVFTNICTENDLKHAILECKILLRKQGIKEYSFVAQEMINGTELIMGMKQDKIFGPVVLFGLGGIFVEILKDVSLRVAPLTRKDCHDMIQEIKSKELLQGYRNQPPVDKNLIVDSLLRLSKLSVSEKDLLEIDFNPIILNKKGAFVVDARVIVDA